MDKIARQSLLLHKKRGGKMEIKPKVRVAAARDLSLSYTPGVAAVSLAIAKQPKLAYDYTIKQNSVAIITDGSAVLGLGNIGPLAALPVMEGKAILYKKFADIDAFPICLKEQNPQKIIEIVKALSPAFGAIHLEDIAAPSCFIIEEALRRELDIPVLHDDQHCTAVVVLAGLINALRVRSVPIHRLPRKPINGHATKQDEPKIVISGAGAAGIAITKLLTKYGFKNIIVLDSKGTIFSGRKNLSADKKILAKITNSKKINGDLLTALKEADVFIGVSKAGLLKPAMIRKMHGRPIIFALANPEPEILPPDAKKAGALVVATGRSDFPNQINNVLAFPGIFRGALDNKVLRITDNMLILAAENLAGAMPNPSADKILPNVFDRSVVKIVAKAIR